MALRKSQNDISQALSGAIHDAPVPCCDPALSGESKCFPITFSTSWAYLSRRLPSNRGHPGTHSGARFTRQEYVVIRLVFPNASPGRMLSYVTV